MKMWNYYLFAVFILCSTQNAFAANVSGVDMQQSLKYAFAYSPNLQSMQESREKAGHEVRIAESGYYPTIGVWGGGGFLQEDTEMTRNSNDVGKVLGSTGLGVAFSQNLWQGGATSSMVRSREASLEASIFGVLDVATSLAYNTVSSHADLLRRYTLLGLAENNVLEHEKILKMLRSRFAQGLSSEGDVQQVVSRLSRAKATLASHKEGYDAALSNYKRITGQYAPAPQDVLPVPNPDQVFSDTKTVRDLSVQHNYSLKTQVAQISSLIGERDYARAAFAPSISLDAGPSYQNVDRGDGGETYEMSWTVMLNVQWNIYNGGADEASFEANSAAVRKARKSLHTTMDRLDEQISLAFNRTMTAGKQAVYFAEASAASNIARDNFFIQFEAGQKDLLSVLDAETEYFTAEVEKIIAMTDTILGQYRMHALAGTLLAAVGMNAQAVSMGKPAQADTDKVELWKFIPSPKDDNPILNTKASTLVSE